MLLLFWWSFIKYKGKNEYSLTQSMQPFQVQFQLWTLCCLRMSVTVNHSLWNDHLGHPHTYVGTKVNHSLWNDHLGHPHPATLQQSWLSYKNKCYSLSLSLSLSLSMICIYIYIYIVIMARWHSFKSTFPLGLVKDPIF